MSEFRTRCPADYTDPMQSDSDHRDDPNYTATQEVESEPTSPKVSKAIGGCSRFRKRQSQKSTKRTPKSTQGEKMQHQLLHQLN